MNTEQKYRSDMAFLLEEMIEADPSLFSGVLENFGVGVDDYISTFSRQAANNVDLTVVAAFRALVKRGDLAPFSIKLGTEYRWNGVRAVSQIGDWGETVPLADYKKAIKMLKPVVVSAGDGIGHVIPKDSGIVAVFRYNSFSRVMLESLTGYGIFVMDFSSKTLSGFIWQNEFEQVKLENGMWGEHREEDVFVIETNEAECV